jgi:hypothetical protein
LNEINARRRDCAEVHCNITVAEATEQRKAMRRLPKRGDVTFALMPTLP